MEAGLFTLRAAAESGRLRDETLAGWMKGAGLGDAPRALIYEFAKIKSGDIVLPVESAGGFRTTAGIAAVRDVDHAS